MGISSPRFKDTKCAVISAGNSKFVLVRETNQDTTKIKGEKIENVSLFEENRRYPEWSNESLWRTYKRMYKLQKQDWALVKYDNVHYPGRYSLCLKMKLKIKSWDLLLLPGRIWLYQLFKRKYY